MANVWGSAVPSWISAAGTLLTFITVVYAARSFRVDARARMDNERRQARQIQATDYRPGRLAVRIVNRSGYSIYDVSLESVRLPSDPDATWKPGALESPEIVGRYQPVSVLIPNRQMVVDIELASGDGIVYDHMQEPLASGKLSYTIEFTDCDGRRWRRTDQQTPERIMT